jgi:hypothetical protein
MAMRFAALALMDTEASSVIMRQSHIQARIQAIGQAVARNVPHEALEHFQPACKSIHWILGAETA